MVSKILRANSGGEKQLQGSRTLAREGAAWVPPAQQSTRRDPTAMERFPFPMGEEGYTSAERSANQTTVNGRALPPQANSLAALSERDFAARRQRDANDIGSFAREGRERADAEAMRNRNRVRVDRQDGEVGGEIPGADAFPFPMGSDVAPGDAGQRRDAAINLASRVTGAPRGYLRALAMQEGMDRADARNPRSSATGYMQFTEDTWLSMMREHGGQYGLSENLRNSIRRRDGGGFYVTDAAARNEIMALRNDPEWSMIMGGHLFQREADTIRRITNRPITVADVYMGHFLGGELGGAVLRDIGRGRGNQEARAYVRRYYASRPGMAQNIIDANPRQFAAGVTLAQLHRMQTGDLIAHGERRGVPAAEMRAIVQAPPRSNMAKRDNGKQLMTAEQITQSANQRDWQVRQGQDDPNAARVDPETGQTQLPTREQQRRQREEEQRRDEEAVRRNRRSVTLRRNGIRVTQPF